MMNWDQLELRELPAGPKRLAHVRCLDDEALSRIEADADIILAEVGLEFRGDPETLELLDGAGFKVDGNRVWFDGECLRNIIRGNAPSGFTIHSRNPDRNVTIGADGRVFAPSYGTPNIRHLDGSYGLATMADYQMLVRLAHDMPVINNTGTLLCFPHDVSEGHRALEVTAAHLRNSDKAFMGSIWTADGCRDAIDLTASVVGADEMEKNCYLMHLINSNPPLVYVEKALKALRIAAARNQGCLITSYVMMGASSSVSAMGLLAQCYAEVMVGAALTQIVRPGAPVIGGIFAVPFSMSAMIPGYGDPISSWFQMAGVQLVRRLGIPVRGEGGITSSNCFDQQAGMESGRNMTAALQSGADFIMHAVGWLENGRTVSVAKFEQESDWLSTVLTGEIPAEKPALRLSESAEDSLKSLLKDLRGKYR